MHAANDNHWHPARGGTIARNAWKRRLDILLGALLLALLAPVFLIVSLCIAAETSGPIFFRQRRTGLHGRTFRIFKFRTMTVCEDGDCVPQAMQADPRITAVGSFLRRTSIDELPQLINVVRGEMSLVGPRPHALAHDEIYRRQLSNYDRRFLARPGITGLAQVRGLRGETRELGSIRSRLQSDLEYIDRWSLESDLRILFRSAAVVFKPTGY